MITSACDIDSPDFVESYSSVSGRRAYLELEGTVAYLYLTKAQSLVLVGDVLVFSTGPLVSVEEIRRFAQSGNPPPLAGALASESAIQDRSLMRNVEFAWSASGDAVAVLLAGEPWAFVSVEKPRGYSKAVGASGFHGEPWSHEAFVSTFAQ